MLTKGRPNHVIEMEQRAKLRAQKRQDLQKLYEEKKKIQQEQERQEKERQEEEAKKQKEAEKEKRRQAKLDEERLKEEERMRKEQLVENIKMARQWHQKQLLRRYILGTFKWLMNRKQNQIISAENLREKQLKRALIHKLRTAIEIQKYEVEQEVSKMSKTAYAFREFNLKVRVFNSLKQNKSDNRLIMKHHRRQIYEKHLQRRIFTLWIKVQHFIRKENVILNEHRSIIITKFRAIKLGRKVLVALQDEA